MSDRMKIREDRARRALVKAGYYLKKTPARSWLRQYYGPGYMILRYYYNDIAAGIGSREYMMALDEVEDFVGSPWDRRSEHNNPALSKTPASYPRSRACSKLQNCSNQGAPNDGSTGKVSMCWPRPV
jgi:hypothetical protein